MVFSKILRLKTSPLSNDNSAKLTVEKLTKTAWDFGLMDGTYIDQVRLLPGGGVEGHENPDNFNKYCWRLEGEKLIFYKGQDENTTVRFTSHAKEKGRWAGRFLLCDDTSHVLMANHNNARLTVEELTKTTWDFGRMDGSLIDQIRLLPNGEIKGHENLDHLNEYHWRLEDGTLTFCDSKGQPSTHFTSCTKEKSKLFLTGRFSLCNSTIHVLMSYKAFEQNLNLPTNFYFGLGNAFHEQERWKESKASYQKALKSGPKSARNFLVLGISQMRNGDVYGAISSYKKAIELMPKQPGLVYRHLGDAFQKKKWWEKAIASYRKAMEVRPWQDQNFYLNLRDVQLKLGQHKEAAQSYKKSFEIHYLISHKHKFIYCNIPKNATQLFRVMTVERSGDRDKFNKWRLHTNMNVNQYLERDDAGVRLTDYAYLDNPEYFKFAILRNPFDRLVSGYLDKFVKSRMPQDFAHPVIKYVYKSLGLKLDLYKGITFSQFIHCLAKTKDDYDMDVHWRPQHTFLGINVFKKFDFIGQFEKLDCAIEYLEEKFGFKISVHDISPTQVHITRYGNAISNDRFHEKHPEELRAFDGFPKSPQLYTPELEMLVRKRYAKDIEIYEHEFNVTLANCV